MTEVKATDAGSTVAQPYPPLLTKDHMAELLGRTVRTIYRWESQGRIPSSVNVGTQRVWVRDEIMHWISSGCPSRRVWERVHPKYRKSKGGGGA
jgi:excisionase family DNA binding protein